jgi:hypothetical protein
MIIAAFKSIMIIKYYGYSVYFHNFSGFDSRFILKPLVNIPDVKTNIIYNEGKFISLNILFDKKSKVSKSGSKFNGSINIYDSLLLLPGSL